MAGSTAPAVDTNNTGHYSNKVVRASALVASLRIQGVAHDEEDGQARDPQRKRGAEKLPDGARQRRAHRPELHTRLHVSSCCALSETVRHR